MYCSYSYRVTTAEELEFYATDVVWAEDLAGRSVLVVSGSDGSVRVIDHEKLLCAGPGGDPSHS